MSIYFDELTKDREEWVRVNKKNGFEKGINNLLTQLYPDNAHFIYELLQNAEDANATEVLFELSEDRLYFEHDGRAFNIQDLYGITSIGQGTKIDDVNKIGKFGVGFKAVFTYTKSPKIYSGDFNFEIIDLVVPKQISQIDTNQKTIMIFPFNNDEKSTTVAFKEVKKGLQDIHDTTLLFLNNICNIRIKYENIDNQITKNEVDDKNIIIYNYHKNEKSKWLRFKKNIPEHPNLYVSIAYAIKENEKTNNDELVPINGEVSIFFPAEKETSNLKFHIHAPFLSTVARDSIKNREENKNFIELIAETVVESFEYLKINGFLTLNFLGVLPNHKDNITPFYEPVFLRCVETFRKQPYMLTESGEYQPSDVCYRGSQTLKKLIDNSDLRVLTNYTNGYWSKNAPQKNSRSDDFIQSLKIDKFDEEDFYKKLLEISSCYGNNAGYREENSDEFEQINTLFSIKTDEWYQKFYLFLKEYQDRNYYRVDKDLKFFIRLKNDQLNIDCKDCFFDNGLQNDDFLYVKKEIYSSSNKESDNEKAQAFLESLGVKEVGEREKIESILNLYDNDSFPDFDEHLNHLDTFLDYFKNSYDASVFANKYFLSCTSLKDKKNYWGRPSDIIMDEPYMDTGLKVIAQYVINSQYKHNLSDSKLTFFIALCKAAGVKYRLEVVKTSLSWRHPDYWTLTSSRGKVTSSKYSEDWTIQDLENLLDKRIISISLLIWDVMRHSNYCLKAQYRPNASSEFKCADSTLVHLLKKSEWIPDQNGNFHKPADMLQDNLPKEFVYDDRNGWLKAIRFGSNNQKNKEYDRSKSIVEEQTGYSVDILEEAKNEGIDVNALLIDAVEKKAKKSAETLQNKNQHHKATDNHSSLKQNDISSSVDQKKADLILCTECNIQLNPKNLKKHLCKVHHKNCDGNDENAKNNQNNHNTPNLNEAIKSHNKNIACTEDNLNPSIVKDEEKYREEAQKRLNENLKKSNTEMTTRHSVSRVKIGKEETQFFLNSQYGGCCQICGFTFDKKGNQGKYFVMLNWLSEKITKQKTNIIEAGSSLCLCANCHSAIKYGNFESKFIKNLEHVNTKISNFSFEEFCKASQSNINIAIPDCYDFIEMDMYKMPIRLLDKDMAIFYTEEHFLLFYNMLTIGDTK